jgi:minor extracellular serine protease Vpr
MLRFVAFLVSVPFLLAQPVPGHYIVELTGPAAAARPARQSLRRALAAQAVEVLDSVDHVANALLVRVRENRLAGLSAIPGVARVYPVFYLRRTVDRALALHKVTDALQHLPSANPGAGIKIAILDTGIDPEHPAFQDPSLAMPDGFPRAGCDSDLAFTNSKIIVARSYARLLSGEEESARDADGHGTAVAMIAAGIAHQGLLGPISGVAPKAWLGSYKVFSSQSDLTRSDVVLKALDDAVADGMHIVNLSLSTPVAPRPADDLLFAAIERAASAGILVVTSAGNLGPDPATIGSPGNSPAALTVGASWNTRIFAGSLTPKDSGSYVAMPVRYDPAEPVTGPLADVSTLDASATACQELPEDSLTGRIALVAYGGCRFEQKLLNVQHAGALAAVIYADTAVLDPTLMAVGQATLPAAVIRLWDGRELQSRLEAEPTLEVTLTFALQGSTVNPNEVAYFSSRGPASGDALKPDLVAAGLDLLVATQRWEPRGAMYSPSGYAAAHGTSFAAPLVTGAAAVLQAARPGLSVDQYRSLLINTAAELPAAPIHYAGAGSLDLDAALRTTLTASPASLSFPNELTRALSLSNLGPTPAVLSLSAVPLGDGPSPTLSASSLVLDPGGTATLTVTLSAAGLPSGIYQGFLHIRDDANNGLRVPYWYAVASSEPRYITLLTSALQGAPEATVQIPFRVTDLAGLTLSATQPQAAALAGGGQVLSITSLDPLFPGVWNLEARLGATPGNNVFAIEAAGLRKEVVIEAR